MGEPSTTTPPPERSPHDRLDSWKEIAAYLNRDVTTVQRWEKREGMPVHRHLHDKVGSVYASRSELDAWTRHRTVEGGPEKPRAAPSMADAKSAATFTASSSSGRLRVLVSIALAVLMATIATSFWLSSTEYFWRDPIAGARFETITDFGGAEQAAAVSHDGHLVAFLSDRDGRMDVWLTQVGSGEFHNLTQGSARELVNPSLKDLHFSPDDSLVAYWTRNQAGTNGGEISVWAVPVLGGQPRPYLAGASEFDWSEDGSRLAYHTPDPGDPLFVSNSTSHTGGTPIYTAPIGVHSHFQLWSPDSQFIYFVQGSLPDKLDVWRIRPSGGTPQRITFHNGTVIYPALLDRRTLLYLASDQDGSGPWLYCLDVERRIPHRLTSGPDRYTSLSATTNGRRLVATLAKEKTSFWRWKIGDSLSEASQLNAVSLTTNSGFFPRLGPGFLIYVSASASRESIWKLAGGSSAELWSAADAQVTGGPSISHDGRLIAFSVREHGRTLLYVMQADGTSVHVVTDALDLQGDPEWEPNDQAITSAASDHGVPHLFHIPLNGRPPTPFVREYSINPTWAPDGSFVIYSGPDVGTTFVLKAANPDGTSRSLPPLTLSRGARHVDFLPGSHKVMLLRGEIQHKDLWLVDLDNDIERQLTRLAPDFDVRRFDISPDGQEVVLERVQEHSDVVLIDLARK